MAVTVAVAGLAVLSVPGSMLALPAAPAHQQALVCDGVLYDNLKAVQVVCDGFQPLGKL